VRTAAEPLAASKGKHGVLLQGYEAMHMLRKGQMQGMNKGDVLGQVAFITTLFRVTG